MEIRRNVLPTFADLVPHGHPNATPEPGSAPPLRKRSTHLFSGFPRESTSKRTKMAVDLSVARRQLGEALGDFSQTYDHLFFLCLRKL